MLRCLLLIMLILTATARAEDPDPADWQSVLDAAKGQTVYFHAWGGDTRINSYIGWAAKEAEKRYGVTVSHVKVTDTATVVSRVLAEKTAGVTEGGTVDLVWVNGENFASLKRNGLLLSEGWADRLPNFAFVDVNGKPTVINDFTVPTDGLEAPWGMAQLTFYADMARISNPPKSMAALLSWAAENPGRFAYPAPPDFIGSTFLKQVLYGTLSDPSVLQRPADEADFNKAVAPVFAFLDDLHPHLWRKGAAFPKNQADLRTLVSDGEIEIGFSFNPSEASAAIASHELPDTVRSFVFDEGTIGNTHFVAIPFNANAKAGAMVFADFLMSPQAQARKQDPNVWGDPTVLDTDALEGENKALFDSLDLGIATLTPAEMGSTLPEPHPSWMTRIEEAWLSRYGS